MHNPLLWLGLSLFLVAVCLVAVLLVAIPVMQELSRTARSAEKLLDMLSRELPPTLQSLRSTGDDLSELSGQVNEGVRSASQVVTQVDQGLETVRTQAESVKRGSLSLVVGLRAAWHEWKHRGEECETEYDANSPYETHNVHDMLRTPTSIHIQQEEPVSAQTLRTEPTGTGQTRLPNSDQLELDSAGSVTAAKQQASKGQV